MLNDLPERYTSNQHELDIWDEKDGKAQAIIGLTLCDELIENVREVKSA